MSQTIDLLTEDLTILQAILQTHLPSDAQIWVFGSRATGSARRYSDLDLAVESAAPLEPSLLGMLRDALSESDLTIKVDVIDLRDVDPAFRRTIASDWIRLPPDIDPDVA